MRRAAGRLLLAAGLLGFGGLAAAAATGLHPFEPFWAFLACATALAGAALCQPAPGGGPTQPGRGTAPDPAAEGTGMGGGAGDGLEAEAGESGGSGGEGEGSD